LGQSFEHHESIFGQTLPAKCAQLIVIINQGKVFGFALAGSGIVIVTVVR
jgi:hypothetical protein